MSKIEKIAGVPTDDDVGEYRSHRSGTFIPCFLLELPGVIQELGGVVG